MNKNLSQLDIDAEREGLAEDQYRQGFSRTIDFGRRLHKTVYAPADVVPTRKRRRPKASKQINLQSQRIRERLENPELYKKFERVRTMTTKADAKTETPTKHFKRIAGGRLGRAEYAIELIGNCIGPGYEHTDEQVEFIQEKLLSAVTRAVEKLQAPVTGEKKQSKHFVKIP